MRNENPSGNRFDDHSLYKAQVRDLEEYALFVSDPAGILLTWNRGIERTFGYTEQEWLGKDARIIFNEDDRKAGVPEAEMAAVAEQGRCSDIRWHRRKDGSRVYMTGVMRSLRDEQGALIGFSKIFVDETARKHLEDTLTQSNVDLQQFAYVASHDLQEPLRTIVSFSQLLQRDYASQLDGKGHHLLQTVLDAGQRISIMIQDLLQYSQLEIANEYSAPSVHLDGDLETALSLLQTPIQESGAVVTHDPLPTVKADRSQMTRLFQNLISNSLKFRKRADPPHIHVSAEQQQGEWLITVRDNGIGFPVDQAEQIFAPFMRLHTKDRYPGTGIGLATCKRIVERAGGRIGAESKPGEGATFWFTLPAIPPES